jgi:hypothetical protein
VIAVSEEAATEEIDLIILGWELVASEERAAVLRTTWDVPLSQLLALQQLERILFSVEQPSQVAM